MKKKSPLLKIVGSIVLLGIGVFLGKSFFGQKNVETVPIPSTMKYRNIGLTNDTTQVASNQEFTGKIIEVKKGSSIQNAVKEANPGDLIRVYPGTYSENVYIDKDNISLQGVVINGEWPTLDGKKKINDAFLYSGNGILIENFKIINYKGNGVMGQAGNNFIIRNNWIIDTGVYGIFPQYGKNGLIEHNVLSKIADAAIYVGMCDNVDVLHNEVFDNVAGKEIENSRHCLVENNYAHNNTGGLLAFVTPGLPIKTTFDVILRNNFVVNNNHENFGAPGSTVAGIPAGTGILIMAADDVVVENNIITGNNNTGITIVDLATGAPKANDPNSEGNPDRVVILDNIMFNNGNAPTGEIKAIMLTQMDTKGPDIFAYGGGSGSTIRDKNRYRTFGLDNYGPSQITDTKDLRTFLMPNPVPPRSVSKEELGELTYYGVCAGCHAFGNRLIGPPTEIIQAIHKDNPQGIVDYITAPKNLRKDYPEMPPQDYLSDEAKMAVAVYILAMKD
ncbi:right-handed parallel beta-helix repeat-containing protein [Arenibacter sp. BSSL-BM3]|uniref:Right-handed parallel beta-helix repeat-containing protein n=1 Tax=Arenibacter arenosicollis TaxID=2762274 RepID=A0ABR7QL43_9FLAO|nr:parallel beta-helix domain-containing protein [Arenibacter arenosicollis]MBC8767834.1 right-handed parallel beta-helix repeat-containing protein [Arenibacter arenosicollis]